MLFETLESRQLLAGVTILMHGYNGNIDGWVSSVADDIAQRIDVSQASEYVMTVGKDSHGNLAVQSLTLKSGPALQNSSIAEAIVELDWSTVSDGSYSTSQVGAAVTDYLMAAHGTMPALADLPIQLIGHSRGASLAVAISQDLGQHDIWVDQVTFLDPHPVIGQQDVIDADFGDTPMSVPSNVVFADNYWRNDGDPFNYDYDGQAVDGTHETDLNNSVQQDFVGSAHISVPAYYDGTVDPDATSDGDTTIIDSWYGDTPDQPARDQTGFIFSRLGGGARPADGISTDFGGTASRVDSGQTGAQWSNITDVRTLGGQVFQIGDKITLRFMQQDRDSGSHLTVFLDPDRNPYNGNNVRTMRRIDLAEQDDISATRVNVSTDGVPAGRYYIDAVITDSAGHTRIAYSRRIQLTVPPVRPPTPPTAGKSAKTLSIDTVSKQILDSI